MAGKLEYVPFLREVGRHFTINRMLTFDSVKLRLDREQPLTFLEFNYMILQAYDFLELSRRSGCRLQMGGSDQWGNIVNGIDFARRIDGTELFGLTTPLITTADGAKMGKTASGAVWLNADALSPYDYWQFWRNTQDGDVGRFLNCSPTCRWTRSRGWRPGGRRDQRGQDSAGRCRDRDGAWRGGRDRMLPKPQSKPSSKAASARICPRCTCRRADSDCRGAGRAWICRVERRGTAQDRRGRGSTRRRGNQRSGFCRDPGRRSEAKPRQEKARSAQPGRISPTAKSRSNR